MGGGTSKYQTTQQTNIQTDPVTSTAVESKVSWQLQERQKEMTCLYNTGNILSSIPTKVGDAPPAIQAVLDLLPPAWMYPNETTATIVFNNVQPITSKSFREVLQASPFLSSSETLTVPRRAKPDHPFHPSLLRTPIQCNDTNIGELEMCIHTNRKNQVGAGCKGMYLAEEVVLFNSIALKLSEYISKMVSNDALLERQKELLCLHRITNNHLLGHGSQSEMKMFLKSITMEIKNSMQFPTICDAQIKLFSSNVYGGSGSSSGTSSNEIVVETSNFSKRRWTLVKTLPINNYNNSSSPRKENDDDDDDISQSILPINYDENGKPITKVPTYNYNTIMGTVTVSYRYSDGDGENPQNPVDENVPWLEEEKSLLNSISNQVALMIHSRSSDTLLSTMLPKEISKALVLTGTPPPPKEHTCSILFTDIVGFTKMSSNSKWKDILILFIDKYPF
jgi:hypothetical protein